jgi:hypothetical protein
MKAVAALCTAALVATNAQDTSNDASGESGTAGMPRAQVPTSHELMAMCPHEIRACIAAHGCMARLGEELERAARTGEGLCEDPAACSPELQAVAAACEPFPVEHDDPPPQPVACDFMDFMHNLTYFERALVEANGTTLAMQIASENEARVQVCADVLRPDAAVSARCSDPHAPTGPSDCAFGELVDCWFHWDRALTPPLDKWQECLPLTRTCQHVHGTMDQCQLPQQADFCVAPGNAENNPEAAIYECRHLCETLYNDYDAANAAGCHGDNSGNRHDDLVCVTEVWQPGEMQPWGDMCCSWCGDSDGDGNPDYQGCCEGMRADGEMGCEESRCEWMCNGTNCFDHGEDQATCEANAGAWEMRESCAESIEQQGSMVRDFQRMGYPESFGPSVWLAEYGDVCCTGYESPSFDGACDNDIDLYNQINACDAAPDCEEDSLIGGLNTDCFACLIANGGADSGPPPIEPCLTDGSSSSVVVRVAQVSIELDMAIETLDTIESGYADYADLLRDVASNLAATLGIDPERVEVIAITGGSVVVEFYVYPDEDGSEFHPEDVAAHFADAQTVTLPALDYTGNVTLADWTTVEWTTDTCGYYTSNIGPDGCEDNGCSWNYDLEECSTPSACEDLTDSMTCQDSGCSWNYDWEECSTPTFEPDACEYYVMPEGCEDNGCNWNYDLSECATPSTAEPYDPGMGMGPSAEPYDPGMGMGPSAEPYNPGTGMGPSAEPYNPGTGMGPSAEPYNPGMGMGPSAEPYNPGTGMGPSAEPHHDPGTGMGPSAEPHHDPGTGMGPSAEPHHDPGTGMGPSAEPGQEAPAHDCALYPDDDGLCGPAGLGCYDNCDAFGDGRCYDECPCSCP